jgi:predicted nucleotidyltransferase
MNAPEIDAAIAALGERISRGDVRFVILFGSAARGEATSESDIDLLIRPRGPGVTRRIVSIVRDVEKRFHVKVSTILSSSDVLADLDRQLLESIIRSGRLLIGRAPRIDMESLDLEAVRLLSLDLTRLDQVQKVRFDRELFGARSVRRYRGRVYSSRTEGRLQRWGGRRVGPHLVVVPERAVPELERFLRDSRVRRLLLPAWIQRP